MMCNTLLTQAWKMNETYFPNKALTTKYVLICLADMAWENGYCYPAISYICKKTLIKRRAVCNALKELETLGFLIKKHVFDKKTGKQTSSDYWVNLPEIILPATHTVHDMHGEGARGARGRVHEVHTNHNIEPKIKPNNVIPSEMTFSEKKNFKDQKQERLDKKQKASKEDIEEIHEHWQKETNQKGGLTKERKSKIKSALETGVKYEGYNTSLTKEQIKEIISISSKETFLIDNGHMDISSFLTQKRMSAYLEGRLKKPVNNENSVLKNIWRHK
jgi:hypothetical protein